MALGVSGSTRLDHLSDESGCSLEAAVGFLLQESRRLWLFIILTLGGEDELMTADGGEHDKVEYVLDKPIDVIPNKESLEFAMFDSEAHQKHIDNASDAQCVMFSSMSLELQRQHEHMFPYEMLKHLESLYASQAQTMEYEILCNLFKCKLHDGCKVSEHVLKMIGLIERLASIGTVLPANVSTNLILQSLPSSFENFIVNFNMNNTKVGLRELHNMLKTYESSTAKVKYVLMVSSSAKSSKWKNKQQQKKKASKDTWSY
ncbi:hypothetical protein SASPL_111937 [Salvia splendens]|uniref:Zinc finger, CCHC-type n=1 Tax=Salvia splendens TaxID=180675 RepID=A0A8X9A4T2_SALSN|nr:hypothetical protein SASPL_111937 [Salvia splendens]